MSFGTAASRNVYQPLSYGREAVPWKQGSKYDRKKKFNYKEKSNKLPLRDRQKQVELDRALEEAEHEARIRANRMLAEKRRRETEAKTVQQRQLSNGILKRNGTDAKSNYVTLTQDQLSTILNTLSKVQGSSNGVDLDIEDKDHLKLILDKPDSSERVSRESGQSTGYATHQLESVLNLSRKVKTSQDVNPARDRTGATRREKSDAMDRKSTKSSSQARPRKQVVMNFNLSGESVSDKSGRKAKDKPFDGGRKRVTIGNEENYDSDEKVFVRRAAKVVVLDEDSRAADTPDATSPTANTAENHVVATYPEQQAAPAEMSPRQRQLLIPRAHMTKGEKMRLQLELETAAIEKLRMENLERARKLGIPLASNDTLASKPQNVSELRDKETYTDKRRASKPQSKSESKVNTREELRQAVVFVEPDFVPGLGDLATTGTVTNSKAHSTRIDSKQVPQSRKTEPVEQLKVRQNVVLSKAELKRLQWEKEKAEAPADYDPWGRPGVGVGPGPQLSYRQEPASQPQQQKRDGYETLARQREVVEQANIPGLDTGRTSHVNSVRAPFQNPTSGVPTSILGVENPPTEMSKPPEPTFQESLTKAQLLRLKWANEKASVPEEYNPYGKPGAGAPIRTDSGTVLTSYHSRQKQMMQRSMEYLERDEQPESTTHTQPAQPPQTSLGPQSNEAPNDSANRINSNTAIDEEAKRNHIRGQLVNLDPATLREREEQRKKELRYQEEIRHQVEEKQRAKREERLQKLKEEADEDAKFRSEKSNERREFEQSRQLNKLKEAKEVSRVDIVAEAMLKAQQEAEILKARRRLDKLQAAGHDITHLKAAYEDKFSPRVGPVISELLTPRREGDGPDVLSPRSHNTMSRRQNQPIVEPAAVPGLELSPRGVETRYGHTTSRTVNEEAGYTSSRVITPHQWRGAQSKNQLQLKEFGVQTDLPPDKPPHEKRTQLRSDKNGGTKSNNRQVRVISGPKSRKSKEPPEAKPWGWKNQVGKKFTAQSKRDPYYIEHHEEKAVRTQARKERLLKQVEANSRHIPDGMSTRASNDRDTVNSYLSPRYMLDNSVSARTGPGANQKSHRETTPRREDNSSLPVKSTNHKQTSSTSNKQAGNNSKKHPADSVPEHGSSGYELSLTSHMRSSPDDEYIPFRRSDAVLSPSNAQEASPMSREHTQAALAREAYFKTMKPAQYGVHMHNIRDAHQPSHNPATVSSHSKDPLYNPSLLTKHPSERQQQLLDSLRQMRQGLMVKQREIESAITPDVIMGDT